MKTFNTFSDFYSNSTNNIADTDYKDREMPRKRDELIKWLKKHSTDNSNFFLGRWEITCRTRFFHSIGALCDLAHENIWLINSWETAFSVWSEKGLIQRSWKFSAKLLQTMPSDVLQKVVYNYSWWLRKVSEEINIYEDIFLILCSKILNLSFEPYSEGTQINLPFSKPITDAINHPIGHVTESILNLYFKRKPNDNDLLPDDIKPLFNQICDINISSFRHGRVLLSSHVIPLFRIDKSWTEEWLLPLFDWKNNNLFEVRAAWEGFLWSSRFYPPLLITLKSQFLETVDHYKELTGTCCRQFIYLLTYSALEKIESFKIVDFREAFKKLSKDELYEVAQVLIQYFEGASNNREEIWKKRVHPFFQKIWPKSYNLLSSNIAESLARLCITTGDCFSEAFSTVQDWLQPIDHPSNVVNLLYKSDLCDKFPNDALNFISKVVSQKSLIPTNELKQCLEKIVAVSPNLINNNQYRKSLLSGYNSNKFNWIVSSIVNSCSLIS